MLLFVRFIVNPVRAYLDRLRERHARQLRHTYAPRLEAFREIQGRTEAESKPKVVPFLNLRLVRGARKVA